MIMRAGREQILPMLHATLSQRSRTSSSEDRRSQQDPSLAKQFTITNVQISSPTCLLVELFTGRSRYKKRRSQTIIQTMSK